MLEPFEKFIVCMCVLIVACLVIGAITTPNYSTRVSCVDATIITDNTSKVKICE